MTLMEKKAMSSKSMYLEATAVTSRSKAEIHLSRIISVIRSEDETVTAEEATHYALSHIAFWAAQLGAEAERRVRSYYGVTHPYAIPYR
jgi:hypothetical protein